MHLTGAKRNRRAQTRPFCLPLQHRLTRLVISGLAALATSLATAQGLPDLVSTIVRGSSVYSAPELFAVYSDYLSEPITAESVRAIATDIAASYVRDGYARPSITVDDRMARAGILAFDIVETRISTIAIDGDVGPYAGQLADLGRGLGGDTLLRSEDLQSTVRRMRELAGLNLIASTERDATIPGAYRLRLDTDFQPVSGRVRLSNRGTDEIGPGFLLGQTDFNGLASGRATLGLVFGTTLSYDEYHGLGVNGAFRPTDSALRFTGSGFRSRSNPKERFVDRDDRYLRDRMSFAVGRPVYDRGAGRLTLSAGLRAEDLVIARSGTHLRDERLRFVELSARFVDTADRTRQFALGLELLQGLDGLGAGLTALDIADDPRQVDPTIVLIDYVRASAISPVWTWRLNALGQYSGDILTYPERFKIGGDRLGRGFEVAEISGDRGLGARVEVLRRIEALRSEAGAVSAYVTYDLAAAWKNDLPGRESAATAGIGLSLSGTQTNGRIELAKPLTHPDVEGREDLSVFLEFSLSW
jgi:hemolysin activation/secretion protein